MSPQLERYQRILSENLARLRENSQLPVRLRPICGRLGIHGIRRGKLERGKSLLVDASAKPTIILNDSSIGAGKQSEKFTKWERFLIAHELGHLVLHQHGAKSPSGSSDYWKLERICDEFARQLLIPEDALTATAAVYPSCRALDQLTTAIKIVETCCVPLSVAAHRISDGNDRVVFFRAAPVDGGGYKILVSTQRNRQGVGQRIKPGTRLHGALSDSLTHDPREIATGALRGIGGIDDMSSGAACSRQSNLFLAVILAPDAVNKTQLAPLN